MGLLDNSADMSQLGLIGGLLTAKKGENWGLLLQNAAQAMEQQRQRALQEQAMRQQMEMTGYQLADARQGQEDKANFRGLSSGAPQPSGDPYKDALAQYSYYQGKGVPDAYLKPYTERIEKLKPKYHVVDKGLVPEPTMPGGTTSPSYQAAQDEWETLPRDEVTGQQLQRNKKTGEMKAVGMKPTQVSVSQNLPPLERREQGDMGALHVKNYGEIQAQSANARKENSLLSSIAKNPIQTSAATPLTATAAAWLSAAGLGGEQMKAIASNAQAFNAAAKDLVLQKQLAQKGPQTESDARRLEQTVASLGNTPESNALIVAFSMAQNNRTISQEKFYNDWWTKNGSFRGADAAWINGPGAASLWDDPSLAKLTPAQSQAPAGLTVEAIDAEINRRRQAK
jgi:hypothetical protein